MEDEIVGKKNYQDNPIKKKRIQRSISNKSNVE
jgi:hypothetical protein